MTTARARSRFAWLENSKLQGLAHLATAITALLTAIALLFAASELNASAEQGRAQALLQREIAANASWERYMEMASERPEFALGLDFGSLPQPSKTAYLWFVERMLFAGEQSLSFDPDDPQWKMTIQIDARTHKSYLASNEFINDSFCAYTVELRMTLIEGFADTDRPLHDRLAKRHAQCLLEGYSD